MLVYFSKFDLFTGNCVARNQATKKAKSAIKGRSLEGSVTHRHTMTRYPSSQQMDCYLVMALWGAGDKIPTLMSSLISGMQIQPSFTGIWQDHPYCSALRAHSHSSQLSRWGFVLLKGICEDLSQPTSQKLDICKHSVCLLFNFIGMSIIFYLFSMRLLQREIWCSPTFC